jgi:hypothetical protein
MNMNNGSYPNAFRYICERFILATVLCCCAINAWSEPTIKKFWLVDTDTNQRVEIKPDIQQDLTAAVNTIWLPVAPRNMSIEAEASDDTKSVRLTLCNQFVFFCSGGNRIDKTENTRPFSLGGDRGGDFTPVDELRSERGYLVSAQPFGEENLEGEKGLLKTVVIRIRQPHMYVNLTEDIGDWSPGDGFCSIEDPASYEFDEETGTLLTDCTLRAAIEEANASAGEQTIMVDGTLGEYSLTMGRFGYLAITESVEIVGYGYPLINANGTSKIFEIDGEAGDVDVEISGLRLTNGFAYPRENEEGLWGGAIAVTNGSSLKLKDSEISESRANIAGAIYVSSESSAHLEDCVLRNNQAGQGLGRPTDVGGITQRGGAIANWGWTKILRCSIYDNVAVRAGGIYNGGSMDIENSTVARNRAVQTGGGIENRGRGSVKIDFSTIMHNSTGESTQGRIAEAKDYVQGGGIYNGSTSEINLGNSIIALNHLGSYDNILREDPSTYSADCMSNIGGVITSYGHNIIGVLEDNCEITNLSDDDNYGNSSERLNPAALLVDFGVRYLDFGPWLIRQIGYRPAAGSLAVDAIDDTRICPLDDQRQTTRFFVRDRDGDGAPDYHPYCTIGALNEGYRPDLSSLFF